MNDIKTLRRFIIRKFSATLLLVGLAEYFLMIFINRIMLPIMTVTYFPQLSGVKLLNIGNIIYLSFLCFLYLLSLLLHQLIPAASSIIMSLITASLNLLGVGTNNGGEIAELSAKSSLMLFLTLTAVMLLLLFPLLCGGVLFSGQVMREFRKLEEKREAERRDNERRRYLMISDIAHDLKTPMTTVSGYARALSDGVVKPGEQQEYLDSIREKTERMNDIVQMLFDYVRLDSEGFELVRKETDICELVRECISSCYQDIEDAGDEIDVDIPDSVIMLSVDRIQFGRVITNLLTNAVKHNGKGTSIKVSVRRETDEARIYVADSGKIIDSELAGSLFDPFVMGDRSRSTGGGSGLGLSVAHKIVEMHGYKIKLVQAPEVARYELGKEYTKSFVILMKLPI